VAALLSVGERFLEPVGAVELRVGGGAEDAVGEDRDDAERAAAVRRRERPLAVGGDGEVARVADRLGRGEPVQRAVRLLERKEPAAARRVDQAVRRVALDPTDVRVEREERAGRDRAVVRDRDGKNALLLDRRVRDRAVERAVLDARLARLGAADEEGFGHRGGG